MSKCVLLLLLACLLVASNAAGVGSCCRENSDCGCGQCCNIPFAFPPGIASKRQAEGQLIAARFPAKKLRGTCQPLGQLGDVCGCGCVEPLTCHFQFGKRQESKLIAVGFCNKTEPTETTPTY